MDSKQDALTQLSHHLIRKAVGDNFDPFMVGTGADSQGPQMRACFYYGVLATQSHFLLFDNQGRGGMCDFSTEEVVAAWPTQQLLDHYETDLDSLRYGKASISDKPAPSPQQVDYDLPSETGSKAVWEDPRCEGRITITDLIRRDRELASFFLEELVAKAQQAKELQQEVQNETATAKPARKAKP